jgi:hypothetical protein
MESYANHGGDSGVVGYQIGEDYIWVMFQGGAVYLYTYGSSGQNDIEQMKRLARQGHGLNEYINRYIRKRYARREA